MVGTCSKHVGNKKSVKKLRPLVSREQVAPQDRVLNQSILNSIWKKRRTKVQAALLSSSISLCCGFYEYGNERLGFPYIRNFFDQQNY